MCYNVCTLDPDSSDMKESTFQSSVSAAQSCACLKQRPFSVWAEAYSFVLLILHPVQNVVPISLVVLNDELNVVLHVVGVGADTVGQDTHFHGAISTAREDLIAWRRLELHDAGT